jgi:hypothetical protein
VKKWFPAIVVAVLIGVVAMLNRDRDQMPEMLRPFVDRLQPRDPETPEAAINDLFDAASDGDDNAYLRLVTGDLKTSLLDTRKQLGRKAFGESLKKSMAGIKGLAVRPAEDAPAGFVARYVDIVFADRNETQRMLLVDERTGWAVASIEQAQMVKPPIPYGTPVFEEPLGAEDSDPQVSEGEAED